MPARKTVAPGRGPTHNMLGRGLLPQGKVERVVLVALAIQLTGVEHNILQVATRKATVVVFGVVLLHIEIDRAVRDVGKALVQDALHHLDLLDDVARGVRLDRGRENIHLCHRTAVTLGVVVGHLHRLQLLKAGLLGDFILAFVGIVLEVAYVGDVAHVAHLVAQRAEVAEQQIERDGGTGVTQVGIAIDRRAADIHTYTTFGQGRKLLLAACQRIVKGKFGIHSWFSCVFLLQI